MSQVTRLATVVIMACIVCGFNSGGLLAATINVPADHRTIPAAIDAAGAGDVIIVAARTYHERINFGGKAITVRSSDPTNPSVVAATIIHGDRTGAAVVFNSGETDTSVLRGFTITNGKADGYGGGGVQCVGSSPTIANNTITGNSGYGGGVYCEGCAPTLTDNNISRNTATGYGFGGVRSAMAEPTLTNNVISNNTGGGVGVTAEPVWPFRGPRLINNTISRNHGAGVDIAYSTAFMLNNIISGNFGVGVSWYNSHHSPVSRPTINWCNVYGNTDGNYAGIADGGNGWNISVDPLFANALAGDYRLRSSEGRWNGTSWVKDSVNSPCIDMGDPASAFNLEPAPNGGRINIGFDGNTPFASKTFTSMMLAHGPTGPGVPIDSLPWVTFRPTVNEGSAASHFILLDAAGEAVPGALEWLSPNRKARFRPSVGALLPNTRYTAQLTPGIMKLNGQVLSEQEEWTFDTLPTLIASGGPTGLGNLPSAKPWVQFRWPVDQASVAARFTLKNAAGAVVPGKIEWLLANQKLRFLPSAGQLAANTRYTLTIGQNVKRTTGALVGWSESFAFETTSLIGPHGPVDGATNVALTARPWVQFRWPVQPATVASRLVLKDASGQVVAGTLEWVVASQKARFCPAQPLQGNMRYTLTVAAGVRRTSGETLPWAESCSFTTCLTKSLSAVSVSAAPTATGAQITLNLASAANVTVSVRNLAGREVAILQPGELAAGMRSLLWNRKSRSGTRVPAGLYLLQVSANSADGVSTRAMISLQLR